MLCSGHARLAHAQYFKCFGKPGTPSREFWFQCNSQGSGNASDDAKFRDLPPHEIKDGRFVRGHVVIHVHYAGTHAPYAPDFERITSVNIRFAHKHVAAPSTRVSERMTIANDRTTLTGGTKPTQMVMCWTATGMPTVCIIHCQSKQNARQIIGCQSHCSGMFA